MKLKKVLCWLCTMILIIGAFCVDASALDLPLPLIIIDNDPVSSTGYSYAQKGTVQFFNSSLYNGDARKSGFNSANYYSYLHPQKNLGKAFHVSVSAYLNHNEFRDPAARYYVLLDGRDMYIGSIDQYNAPGGWNKIGDTGEVSSSTYYARGLKVRASGSGIDYTGYDAINIQYVMK